MNKHFDIISGNRNIRMNSFNCILRAKLGSYSKKYDIFYWKREHILEGHIKGILMVLLELFYLYLQNFYIWSVRSFKSWISQNMVYIIRKKCITTYRICISYCWCFSVSFFLPQTIFPIQRFYAKYVREVAVGYDSIA